jgi:hypothetical protein
LTNETFPPSNLKPIADNQFFGWNIYLFKTQPGNRNTKAVLCKDKLEDRADLYA